MFGIEYFWTVYWIVAFLHAILYARISNGGADNRVEAFWMTAGFTVIFPMVAAHSIYFCISHVLFWLIGNGRDNAQLNAKEEVKNLIIRVKQRAKS